MYFNQEFTALVDEMAKLLAWQILVNDTARGVEHIIVSMHQICQFIGKTTEDSEDVSDLPLSLPDRIFLDSIFNHFHTSKTGVLTHFIGVMCRTVPELEAAVLRCEQALSTKKGTYFTIVNGDVVKAFEEMLASYRGTRR